MLSVANIIPISIEIHVIHASISYNNEVRTIAYKIINCTIFLHYNILVVISTCNIICYIFCSVF